jgi:hypothetical protein
MIKKFKHSKIKLNKNLIKNKKNNQIFEKKNLKGPIANIFKNVQMSSLKIK